MKWIILVFMLTISGGAHGATPCDDTITAFKANFEQHRSRDLMTVIAGAHAPLLYQLLDGSSLITRDQYEDLKAGQHDLSKVVSALVLAGRADQVKQILTYGLDANSTTETGVPLLVVAAQCNRVETAKILLEGGASVQSHDAQNVDAMGLSIIGGSHEFAELLAEHNYVADDQCEAGRKTIKLAGRLYDGQFQRYIRSRPEHQIK